MLKPMNRNLVGWFEIPVLNMERAISFYEALFSLKMTVQEFSEFTMAFFPSEDAPGAPGSLVHYEKAYKPSRNGVLIYFTSPSGDLANEEAKIEPAGGKILISKRLISEDAGYMSLFEDTEGNRLALHSRK
jgi:predicted enzyme related to lactoylglutathione lyase